MELIRNKLHLIQQITKSEITSRYHGSYLGILWALLNPVLMLIVYTFVFSIIFEAKWGVENESKIDFALILFMGLIIHGFFSEIANRSPTLITDNPNYVKKIVFPLAVLPVSIVASSLFNMLIALSVLMIFIVISGRPLHIEILLLPLTLIPLIVLSLGICYLIAAIGVYIKDVKQITSSITTLLMFLSPIFYSMEKVSGGLKSIIENNPLTPIIEISRKLVFFGDSSQIADISISFLVSIITLVTGWFFFKLSRKGFADVI